MYWGRAVSLTLADGTIVQPVGWDPNDARSSAPDHLVFAVPADLATATLTITYSGQLREQGDVEIVPSGAPFTLTVTL